MAEWMGDLRDKSLDEVARHMAGCQPNSQNDQEARAEFLRRQTAAAQETARATQKYTRYMFWSVVVLAASALGTLLLQIFDK